MIHLYVLSTTSVIALLLLHDVLLEASGWGAFHFLVLAFTPFDCSTFLVFSTSFYAAFLAFSSVFKPAIETKIEPLATNRITAAE